MSSKTTKEMLTSATLSEIVQLNEISFIINGVDLFKQPDGVYIPGYSAEIGSIVLTILQNDMIGKNLISEYELKVPLGSRFIFRNQTDD